MTPQGYQNQQHGHHHQPDHQNQSQNQNQNQNQQHQSRQFARAPAANSSNFRQSNSNSNSNHNSNHNNTPQAQIQQQLQQQDLEEARQYQNLEFHHTGMIEAETKAAYYPPPTMTVYPSTPPASSRFSGAVPAVGGATGTTDGTDPSFHIVSVPPPKQLDWVYNPSDGSVLVDHKGRPMSVDRILATKPLRAELSTRPGPGGKKLTYISGEGVSRTLNDIFGFDGWNLDITKVAREECLKDDRGRFTVVYTAMVRLTHKKSGAYKEDCGAGDSTDKSFGTAVAHALKASITDAMKRAARHFGDKLGNSLYQGSFTVNKAPTTLKDALDKFEIERANSKFGFPKDQKFPPPQQAQPIATTTTTGSANAPQSVTNVNANNMGQVPNQNQNGMRSNPTATNMAAPVAAPQPAPPQYQPQPQNKQNSYQQNNQNQATPASSYRPGHHQPQAAQQGNLRVVPGVSNANGSGNANQMNYQQNFVNRAQGRPTNLNDTLATAANNTTGNGNGNGAASAPLSSRHFGNKNQFGYSSSSSSNNHNHNNAASNSQNSNRPVSSNGRPNSGVVTGGNAPANNGHMNNNMNKNNNNINNNNITPPDEFPNEENHCRNPYTPTAATTPAAASTASRNRTMSGLSNAPATAAPPAQLVTPMSAAAAASKNNYQPTNKKRPAPLSFSSSSPPPSPPSVGYNPNSIPNRYQQQQQQPHTQQQQRQNVYTNDTNTKQQQYQPQRNHATASNKRINVNPYHSSSSSNASRPSATFR